MLHYKTIKEIIYLFILPISGWLINDIAFTVFNSIKPFLIPFY